MITNEGIKALVKGAVAAGLTPEQAAAMFKNYPAPTPEQTDAILKSYPTPSPVPGSSDEMTFNEALIFCEEHGVDIFTCFDKFSRSFIVEMKRGRKACSSTIRAEDVFSVKDFPIRKILTKMVEELDAIQQEP